MLTQAEIDRLIASRDELVAHLRREIKFNKEQAANFADQMPKLKAYFNGTAVQHKTALLRAGIPEE